MVTMVLEEAGISPKDSLVVGDRVDTDIASGQAAGCPTHLVLTGVAHAAPNGQSFSQDLSGLLS
jgi:ribonucleotide monophosphatase NagD (HAD superfamily)